MTPLRPITDALAAFAYLGRGARAVLQTESEVVPLVLFLALAALFGLLGLFLLLRPGNAAAFFADAEARRRFRPRDARALGVVFAVGGAALAVLGVVRLVALLTVG